MCSRVVVVEATFVVVVTVSAMVALLMVVVALVSIARAERAVVGRLIVRVGSCILIGRH